MKSPATCPRLVLLASGLIFFQAAAFADVAPSVYRPQADEPHVVEPIAQAHLDAAARDLHFALDYSRSANTGRPEDNLLVIRYGGYFQKAQHDMDIALVHIDAATAYLKAHPEANPLAAGPVTAADLKTPPLPTMYRPSYGYPLLLRILDNLDLARDALVNNPAKDYRGAILGDIGGFRAKILADIGQIGNDLISGILYDRNAHGAGTGLISFSAPALLPDATFGPTADTHLQAIEHYLKQLNSQMGSSGQNFRGGRRGAPDNADATQGGNVAKVAADMDKTLADAALARAYLKDHPESNPLRPGPAAPEVSSAQPIVVPDYAVIDRSRAPLVGYKLNANSLDSLNASLALLVNNPSPDYHGVVLGDLGGFRAKIMDDLHQTALDTLAGMDFSLKETSNGAPLPIATANPVTPPPTPAPTALAHLEAAQFSLMHATTALHPPGEGRYVSIPPYGGFLDKTAGNLHQTLLDVQAAIAYVAAHPEENTLPIATATLEKIKAPQLPLLSNHADQPLLAETTAALYAARQVLLNNSPDGQSSPLLTDLGGLRAKILDDLSQAGANLNAAVDFYNAHGDDQGVIPIPTTDSANPSPTANSSPASANKTPMPTAMAGLALSLALSLGGLHILSSRRSPVIK